jgi:hypothetical protein
VVSLLLLVACSEVRETTYGSITEAQEDGAFERGWLPPELPSTTRSIREAHDLDTNVGWIAIRYDSAEYPVMSGIYRNPEWEFVRMTGADGACDSPTLPLTGGRRSCALREARRRIPTSIHAWIRQLDTVGGSSCHLPQPICLYGTVRNL